MGPPNAVAYYDALGAATGDPLLTAIPVDQFGRAQIRDIRLPAGPGTGAVLRQGAWQSDGDPTNVQGEGLVVYGPAPNGLHDGQNGTIGRVKYDRFQIRMIMAGVDIGSAWRVDTVRQWFTDDAGNKTAEIVRATGKATFEDLRVKTVAPRFDALIGPGVVQVDALGQTSVGASGVTWGTTVRFVDLNAPIAGQDGTSEHPYISIQDGLNAAGAGDTVLVAPGYYLESILWPSTDNLTLEGVGLVIIDALPLTDTLDFSPGAGVTIDRMVIRNITLRNTNAGFRCLVLDGNNTAIGNQAQFLRVLGLLDQVLLDKSNVGDAAFIRVTSVLQVLNGTGLAYGPPGAEEIAGWTGRTWLINPGHTEFRGCTLGVIGGASLEYLYDDNLPVRPYAGRQGVFLVSATACFGTIVLGGTPLFVVDPTCVLAADISDSGLTTHVGTGHAPVIQIAGLIGSIVGPASIVLALPAMGATRVPRVDLSEATVYTSTAKPLNISSLALGFARNCVRAHGSRLEGTQASSVIAGQWTDLDIRRSFNNQSALASTGAGVAAGGIDRDASRFACVIPVAPFVVSPVISPPLPPVSAVWYPLGAPYTVRYELAIPSTLPGTTAKTNVGFTATGTAAVTAIAIVARD